jgi:hypothetical protein
LRVTALLLALHPTVEVPVSNRPNELGLLVACAIAAILVGLVAASAWQSTSAPSQAPGVVDVGRPGVSVKVAPRGTEKWRDEAEPLDNEPDDEGPRVAEPETSEVSDRLPVM